MFAQLGGKAAPACGFAMGVERLLALMGTEEQPAAAAPDAYLVHSGTAATQMAWRAVEQLRGAGLDVILHCGGGNFKAQMKRADASGARFAVIIGDNEAAANQVGLKPLRELTEQQCVTVEDAIARMRARGELTI